MNGEELEVEMEVDTNPRCAHKVSSSGTIVEVRDDGAKTTVAWVNSTGQRAVKPADLLFPMQILKPKLMT